MNATTNTELTAVQTAPAQAMRRTTAIELVSDPVSMDRMMRMAEIMASGVSTTPKHLQKNVGDCFAVVIQAHVWGMLPHIVAQKTHLVNGTLGYEAQLVTAVVEASGKIEGRFHYEYQGKSPNLECRVGAVIKGETEITWGEWLSEAKVKTKNSPLWQVNPAQQLGYLQSKNWSRLYTSGAILGIYTPDELEAFKPPVNMGKAEVLDARPALDEDALIKEGWANAEKGMNAFGPWFNALPKLADGKQREILKPHRDAMLAKAKQVDDARTVEHPSKQDGGTQTITYEDLKTKIENAQTVEGLMIAADWIEELKDPAQREELTKRYMELHAKFGGAA